MQGFAAAGDGCKRDTPVFTPLTNSQHMHVPHTLGAHMCVRCCLAAGCADKQVGIVWNYFWFEPKRSSWWTPFYLPWIRRGSGCGVVPVLLWVLQQAGRWDQQLLRCCVGWHGA